MPLQLNVRAVCVSSRRARVTGKGKRAVPLAHNPPPFPSPFLRVLSLRPPPPFCILSGGLQAALVKCALLFLGLVRVPGAHCGVPSQIPAGASHLTLQDQLVLTTQSPGLEIETWCVPWHCACAALRPLLPQSRAHSPPLPTHIRAQRHAPLQPLRAVQFLLFWPLCANACVDILCSDLWRSLVLLLCLPPFSSSKPTWAVDLFLSHPGRCCPRAVAWAPPAS
jgi:hypothetical protein